MRPRSPGVGTLDMRRIPPGDFTLGKSPATLNPCRNRFGTSHEFDCKHFAAAKKLTQRQTAAPLCKNCGGAKFPVDGKGKNVLLLAPRAKPSRRVVPASGKTRVARTLLSACQSHPPAQSSQNRCGRRTKLRANSLQLAMCLTLRSTKAEGCGWKLNSCTIFCRVLYLTGKRARC